MYIVILAGGSGTRFWPLSREKRPKQLMSIFGGKSMLQRTVERILPLSPTRVLIVTNSLQAEQTAKQLEHYRERVPIGILEEPVGRNTAPAIALAAAAIFHHDPEGLMLVLPADHYITREDEFLSTIDKGLEAAGNGKLVTLGIVPSRPETGYGYIEVEDISGTGPYQVKRFVEKPDLAKALEFVEAGNFFWNSGMFLWRADVILGGIRIHMPPLASALEDLPFAGCNWDLSALKPKIMEMYGRISGQSIDYGVMEKADNVVVIPSSFGWSDVGSWSALPDVLEGDGTKNVAVDVKQLIALDSGECIVSGTGKIVALLGVNNLVIVDTEDALMVCDADRTQEVRNIVEELRRRELVEYL